MQKLRNKFRTIFSPEHCQRRGHKDESKGRTVKSFVNDTKGRIQ